MTSEWVGTLPFTPGRCADKGPGRTGSTVKGGRERLLSQGEGKGVQRDRGERGERAKDP